ncbi:MAG: BACON domain-containing protein, partial [Bacteroidales bacterium]|nr:BACON domain-containing protein [Bacteroidales bacterium]
MKSILKTVASLSVLLLAASCTLEQIDTQMTPEKAKASIRLECSALESYTVQAAKPQDISFHVSATTPWTITGKDADWLTVTPASSSVSSLSEDIRITAKANNDFADRKAVLTVSGENTETSYTITVTQLRKGKLTVAPIAGEFETAGGSKTFTVEANIAWEASAADEWLTLNPASGTSDGATKSFTVTATAANNSSVTRSTTVTVAAGDEKQEFEVVQKGQTLEILPVENPTIDRKG